jgi:hypothetical protein
LQNLLPLIVRQTLEVIGDGFAMPCGHALHEILQSTLLFPRRQTAPFGHQFLELRLIDIAIALAWRDCAIAGRSIRLRALR